MMEIYGHEAIIIGNNTKRLGYTNFIGLIIMLLTYNRQMHKYKKLKQTMQVVLPIKWL